MKKQPVDYQPAIAEFEAALDGLGIKTMDITKGGVKKRVVSLKGSDVEGDTGAKQNPEYSIRENVRDRRPAERI
jgi:hypothetical protein